MDRIVFNVLYMLDLHAMPLILLKITFQKLYCIMLNNYMTIFFGWRKYMSKTFSRFFPDQAVPEPKKCPSGAHP